MYSVFLKETERADFAIVADPVVVAAGHYGGVGRLRRLKATSIIRQSSIFIRHSLHVRFNKLQYGVNLILTVLNFNERGITA